MPRKYNIDFVYVIKWLLSSSRVLQMLQPDWLSYCTYRYIVKFNTAWYMCKQITEGISITILLEQ